MGWVMEFSGRFLWAPATSYPYNTTYWVRYLMLHAPLGQLHPFEKRPFLENGCAKHDPTQFLISSCFTQMVILIFHSHPGFEQDRYGVFKTAPDGTWPDSTYRHKAIASLRAKATIITRRMRLLAPQVLWKNHLLRSVSG